MRCPLLRINVVNESTVTLDRELHTPRLLLREPRPGDAPLVFERWAQDAEALSYLGWRPHAELANTRRMLEWDAARWLTRSACTWMLVGADGPVGQVQLVAQSFEPPVFHWRLGYVLARPYQKRGFMREAVSAVLEHAFTRTAVWRVDALCDVDNVPSQRLLSALGLRCEGRLAAHTLHPNVSAHPRDVWMYARTRLTADGG
jgi:RimJ/RimL family protein N-acetyltransferase